MAESRLVIRLEDDTPPEGPPPSPADVAKGFVSGDAARVAGPTPPAAAAAQAAAPPPGRADPPTGRALDDIAERVKAGLLGLEEGVSRADRLARSPAGKQLDTVADRVGQGLLTAAEAMERLEKVGRSDAALDYARDAGARDFQSFARDAIARAAGLGSADALLERLAAEARPESPAASAKGVLDAPPAAPPPAEPPHPPAGFDFTPAGGVPFDFAPEAVSPDAPKRPTRTFDFVDVRGAGELPRAGRAAAGTAEAVAGPAAAEGAAAAGEVAALGTAATAAAGPLGAVVLAAEKLGDGLTAARADLAAAGTAARAVASNDGLGAMTAVSDRVARGLESAGAAGKVAAEGVRFAAAAAREFDSILQAVTARGRELAAYDPRLAGAAADAEIKRLAADAREAGRTSEGVSRAMTAEADLRASFQDALSPVKSLIADRAADLANGLRPVVDATGRLVEVAVDALPSMKATVQAGFELIGATLPVVGWTLGQLQKQVEKLAKDAQAKRDEEEEKLMRQFFDAADALGLNAPNPNNAVIAAQRAQVLGLPLLAQ